MSIDLSKLIALERFDASNAYAMIGDDLGAEDVDFYVVARKAFDGDPEALAWWEANRVRAEQEKANA